MDVTSMSWQTMVHSQPTEDQGRATGYGSLTQKLGSSPFTMLDFLGGLGHMKDNLSEVHFHG